MEKQNKIVFFIGPSGSGKDTFLVNTLNKYQINPIILLTTRPKRIGEQEGREYHFITPEKMDLLEQRELLIERRNYNTEHGIWSYATGANKIDLSKCNYLTPNTWEGYKKFLNYYPKEVLVPIYFQMDDGIRLERCLRRERRAENGKYAEMCRRFLADQKDFSPEMLDIYKPYIINNNGSKKETEEQLQDIFVRKLEIMPK